MIRGKLFWKGAFYTRSFGKEPLRAAEALPDTVDYDCKLVHTRLGHCYLVIPMPLEMASDSLIPMPLEMASPTSFGQLTNSVYQKLVLTPRSVASQGRYRIYSPGVVLLLVASCLAQDAMARVEPESSTSVTRRSPSSSWQTTASFCPRLKRSRWSSAISARSAHRQRVR